MRVRPLISKLVLTCITAWHNELSTVPLHLVDSDIEYNLCNVLIGATLWCDSDMAFRDLSEISRGEGGKGILNLGSEMRCPIPAMGVKFANLPVDLGLKYYDPPPLV